jgi:rod shape-determining protein MreD
MRWLRFAVLVLAAVLVQAGLLGNLSIRPDLLVILLVFFAAHANPTDAIIASFTIGFTADLIGLTMGPQMLSFGLFGSLLAYLRRVIAIRRMPVQGAVIFITGVFCGLLASVLASFKGEEASAWMSTEVLKTSLCSAIVGPFLFLPTAWWMRIRTRRFGRY